MNFLIDFAIPLDPRMFLIITLHLLDDERIKVNKNRIFNLFLRFLISSISALKSIPFSDPCQFHPISEKRKGYEFYMDRCRNRMETRFEGTVNLDLLLS